MLVESETDPLEALVGFILSHADDYEVTLAEAEWIVAQNCN